MVVLAQLSPAYARLQQVDLPNPPVGVTDRYIVDSTMVKLQGALFTDFPESGSYVKVHKILPVGCGILVLYHFNPVRENDCRHPIIDASWQGCSLLTDLTYASFDRLWACQAQGVRMVICLKDSWKPKIDYLASGQLTRESSPGAALDAPLDDEILVLDGLAIDPDVQVGRGQHTLLLRLCGAQTTQGDGFFLPILSPRVVPRQVAGLHRAR